MILVGHYCVVSVSFSPCHCRSFGWVVQGFDNLFSYHQVMKRRKFRKACLYVTSRGRCTRSYRMKFSLLQLYRLKGEDCKDFY